MRPARRTFLDRHLLVRIAALAMTILAIPLLAARRTLSPALVEIVVPSTERPPAKYGIERLREALETAGFRVTERPDPGSPADFIVVAGTSADCEAARVLERSGSPRPSAPEALAIRRVQRYQ